MPEKAGIVDNQNIATEKTCRNHSKNYRQMAAPTPWQSLTINAPVIIHESAHWVWSAGGDFIP